MSQILKTLDEVDSIAVQIEQLGDILAVLHTRYFEESLTDVIAERTFALSHSRIGNIIAHAGTQLTEYAKRLEQAVQQIYFAEESHIDT